jgi:small subunit ribosomal protein S9
MEILARSVGRRKEAVAQVQIVKSTNETSGPSETPRVPYGNSGSASLRHRPHELRSQGSGQFLINNVPAEHYLHNNTCFLLSIKAPLTVLRDLSENQQEEKTYTQTVNMSPQENTGDLNKDTGGANPGSAQTNLSILNENFDTIVKVKGGGLIGQAEAIKLGLSRAICQFYSVASQSTSSLQSGISENSVLKIRKEFKDKGYLTQDSRVKERRKYGLKKARKASQYHKR